MLLTAEKISSGLLKLYIPENIFLVLSSSVILMAVKVTPGLLLSHFEPQIIRVSNSKREGK